MHFPIDGLRRHPNYCRASEKPLPTLIESIKEHGLVRPVMIAWHDGYWYVQDGWLRIMACRKLGKTDVEVFRVGYSEMPGDTVPWGIV